MKHLSLVLNVVLLVAVSVLFYLHFSSGKKGGSVSGEGEAAEGNVLYINTELHKRQVGLYGRE
jgi:outer membrane protein